MGSIGCLSNSKLMHLTKGKKHVPFSIENGVEQSGSIRDMNYDKKALDGPRSLFAIFILSWVIQVYYLLLGKR